MMIQKFESHEFDMNLRPIVQVNAPGRINLIGEHTDYNGGKVLPFAMDRAIQLNLKATKEETDIERAHFIVKSSAQSGILSVTGEEIANLVRVTNESDPGQDIRSNLPHDVCTSWTRYALGALVGYWRIAGFSNESQLPNLTMCEISGNLPHGAGISSSAALTTGIISAFLSAHSQKNDRSLIAREAMRVEHQFAGIRCGLMDQLAVLMSKKDCLTLIDFRDFPRNNRESCHLVQMHSNFARYRPLLINTMIKHELGASPYNERRLACEEGVNTLGSLLKRSFFSAGDLAADHAFMTQFTPDGLQDTLSKNLQAFAFSGSSHKAQRISHAIMETKRVEQAVKAIETGDLEELMNAINASHMSLSKDYEVSCHELDFLRQETLEVANKIGHEISLSFPPILGSRMTGGGFGGCTIQLVHEQIISKLIQEITSKRSQYYKHFRLIPDVIKTSLGNGLSIFFNR